MQYTSWYDEYSDSYSTIKYISLYISLLESKDDFGNANRKLKIYKSNIKLKLKWKTVPKSASDFLNPL